MEPLFIQAKKDAAGILNSIHFDRIDYLPIQDYFKTWLKEGDRLSKIQFYADAMTLNLQEEPFMEDGLPRGTGFDSSDPNDPKLIVSRTLNTQTSPDEAIALVIHEAGHFTGEMNHLFLSRLGVQLQKAGAQIPECNTSDLRLVEPGFKCRTSKSAVFERAHANGFEEVLPNLDIKQTYWTSASRSILIAFGTAFELKTAKLTERSLEQAFNTRCVIR
ncbi:hypothetical protein WDW86_14105 [Bdellovibrionota bacterium FG-2]